MMRVSLFKPVHVKTLASQETRMLLTARKLVQRKMLDVESDLRGTLRNCGLKVGTAGSFRFEDRIRELVEGLPRLASIPAAVLFPNDGSAITSWEPRVTATLQKEYLAGVRLITTQMPPLTSK